MSTRTAQHYDLRCMRAIGAAIAVMGLAPQLHAQSGYVAGDFHQHTTYSDGAYSFQYQMFENNRFGLDWWANSEHGGRFTRDAFGGPTNAPQFRYWDDPVAYPGLVFLGSYAGTSGGHRNMWRWQSLRDFSFNDVLAARATYPTKTIIQGVEWNVPGHEHCSVAILANQFGPNPNADAVAEFVFKFDAGDTDTIGATLNNSNNPADAIWTKSTLSGHAKAVEAAAWLQANYRDQSWLVIAHPERKQPGSGGYTIADLRDFNNAAPDVAFGFESMPGHQKSPGRGGYGTSSVGGGTYGGCGIYAAQVGGLWDAMLGEGRRYWLFASSDSHSSAPTDGDFSPGEYQKTYTYVADKNDIASHIVAGLKSGNSFVVSGDLIDRLEFTVGDATMGQTYQATSTSVTVNILVRDPQGPNNGPPGLNMPVLDHIDLIAGRVTGLIDPSDPQYHVATNPTTRVIARFDAVGGIVDSNGLISTAWMDLGNGERMMSLTVHDVVEDMYFRLRGTNLGLNVSGETDAAGNPLGDWLSSYHIAGNHEHEAWADLWFYSNPVFVAAVPEPGTLSMLALAGLALLRRRRMA
jgi:hypothetical protein